MALATLGRSLLSSVPRVVAPHLPCNIPSLLYFSTTQICAKVRDYFPRPSERKRINRHGWKKRMSTLAGRKILMNRILKGRFVLSH